MGGDLTNDPLCAPVLEANQKQSAPSFSPRLPPPRPSGAPLLWALTVGPEGASGRGKRFSDDLYSFTLLLTVNHYEPRRLLPAASTVETADGGENENS